MISNIKILNEKSLNNFIDLIENKMPELVKIGLNINDPLIELTFKYDIKNECSLFIDISFISVNDKNKKNWSYSNKVKGFKVSQETILIDFDFGNIFFNYEWGQVNGIKKIKNGSF